MRFLKKVKDLAQKCAEKRPDLGKKGIEKSTELGVKGPRRQRICKKGLRKS